MSGVLFAPILEALGDVDGVEGIGEAVAELDNDSITVPVSSTAIASATYRLDGSATIEFTDGDTADYPSLPMGIFIGLVMASSPGGYYNAVIRGRY